MRIRKAGLPPIAAVLALTISGAVEFAHAQADPANGKTVFASNALKLSSNAPVSGFGSAGSAPKRFLIPFAGIVRMKWKVRSDTAGRTASVSAASNLGTCFDQTKPSTTSTTFVDGTCDLRVVAGDIVNVTVMGSQGSFTDPVTPDTTGIMRDVNVSFTVQDGTGLGKVLP